MGLRNIGQVHKALSAEEMIPVVGALQDSEQVRSMGDVGGILEFIRLGAFDVEHGNGPAARGSNRGMGTASSTRSRGSAAWDAPTRSAKKSNPPTRRSRADPAGIRRQSRLYDFAGNPSRLREMMSSPRATHTGRHERVMANTGL
jgi:hypothetical protein